MPIIVGGVSDTLTVADITFNRVQGAGVKSNFSIIPSKEGVQFSNNTPAVCSIDSFGGVNWVSDGVASIAANLPGVGTRTISKTISNSVTTAYTGVNAYAAGSLIKHLYDQQTALLTAVNALPSNPGSNAINQQYLNGVPSATLMTGLVGINGYRPFDVTTVAKNTGSASTQAWISPHHWISGIGAAHGVGSVYGQTVLVGGDCVIGYSAAPYVGTLTKFLPPTWRSYLPRHSEAYPISGVPCWARLTNTYNGSNYWIEPVVARSEVVSSGMGSAVAQITYPREALSTAFCKTYNGVICTGGDSGSPVFCGINGTPVLLGRVYGYGGAIDWYGDILDAATTIWINPWPIAVQDLRQNDITSAMNKLASLNGDATVYALQYVDLTGFTTF
jgi:hypothetical protein